MEIAPIIRSALDLWQNPPLGELSSETVVGCVNRCISQRFLDLDLTVDACFLVDKTDAFTFASSTSREKDISTVFKEDPSRVLRVESRDASSTSEDDWGEETRASYENWNEVTERGDMDFCAIYGLQPDLTLVVARDVSNLEFRIVYQTLRDKIQTEQDVVDIPAIYESVLVYDIALEFGELIDNQSPEFMKKKADKMPYLESRLKDTMARVDLWRSKQKGVGITYRRAFNDRTPNLSVKPRRFSVTW